MTTETIVVATSIAPKGIEAQKAALDTWMAHGVRILSVNCGPEVAELAPVFPAVEFIDVGELDVRHTTRKLVYFDQLLAALKNSGGATCGIVNSDIHFVGSDVLAGRLMDLSQGGMVFGARTDVASATDAIGTPYAHGFDYFFFDRSLIDIYPASPFRLGAPWWDLWAPIVPLVKGLPVSRIVDPIARHIRHESAWSQEQEWQTYGALFMDAVYGLSNGGWANMATGTGQGADNIWGAFCRTLADRLFAHHQLLTQSIKGQDPTTQALIRATNDQTALVVGQAMRLMLHHAIPGVHLGAGA